MTIRPAEPADLSAIAAIQTACLEAAHWNPSEYLQYSCQVADIDGAVVGFIVSRQSASEEHEILNLAVDPRLRRKSIARRLLAAVTGPQQAWFLEVRESNRSAIAFYGAMGFQSFGRREKYYKNPSEAAIVMRRFS